MNLREQITTRFDAQEREARKQVEPEYERTVFHHPENTDHYILSTEQTEEWILSDHAVTVNR